MEIDKLRSLRNVSSTRNKEDVVLEPCILGECVFIVHPRGVKDKYSHFYTRVLEDFNIHISFIDFESGLLKSLNNTPSQLRPNSWWFIKDFEIVYEAIGIKPTIGLFFSFFEIKGVEKRRWMTISGLLGKIFLQAYTTNYKGFKKRFLCIRYGPRCP